MTEDTAMLTVRPDDLVLPELCYQCVGCAMKVHSTLGPGLGECLYQACLLEELNLQRLRPVGQPILDLVHRGILADEFQPDFIVSESIVLELKAHVGVFADAHLLQLLCYLKCAKKQLGILLNFGMEKLEYQRVVYRETMPVSDWRLEYLKGLQEPADHELVSWLRASIAGLLTEYGLGYRTTTYQGLFRAELLAEQMPFQEDVLVDVNLHGHHIGESRASCFMVRDRALVMIDALSDKFIAARAAILRTYLRHLGVSWGVLLHFGKKELIVIGATP